MVKHIRNGHQDSYESLNDNQKKSVLFVRHQELITETDKNLRTISDFIGEEPSADTPSVLSKENCPRSPDIKTPFSTSDKEFNEKLKEIKKLSTSNSYDSLIDMKKEFESTILAI